MRDMAQYNAAPDQIRVSFSADVRYLGQGYELTIAVDGDPADDPLARLSADFHARHQAVYGHCNTSNPLEIVTLRAALQIPGETSQVTFTSGTESRPVQSRQAYFPEIGAYTEVPVYRRSALTEGAVLKGPAIVEQPDTVTVIYPGQTCTVVSSYLVIDVIPQAPVQSGATTDGRVLDEC